MAKPCVFCGEDVNADPSEEHAIPRWLLTHLGLNEGDLLFQGVADSETDALVGRRVHETNRFVEGRVCYTCNHGWMERLETANKSLLVDLIENRRALWSLSLSERERLANWAVKTAYVVASAAPLKRPVPESHRRAVYASSGGVPSGVGIFGIQSPFTKDFSYFLSGLWPHFGDFRDVDDGLQYKIGLQFRHLSLLVACWPDATSRFVVACGVHVPIWPAPLPVFPAHFVDLGSPASSPELVRAVTESLAIMHPPVE
jgi:hypothetical protein